MWACHFDQLDNLQLLLAVQEKSNPAPEARYQVVDKNGRTILHWAVTKMTNVSCMKVGSFVIHCFSKVRLFRAYSKIDRRVGRV